MQVKQLENEEYQFFEVVTAQNANYEEVEILSSIGIYTLAGLTLEKNNLQSQLNIIQQKIDLIEE